MKLEDVVKKLKIILQSPLPGRLGQETMAPQPIDEKRFPTQIREDFKKGAVLILFYPQNEQTLVPFIKRSQYEGVHSGQIAFPGGKWEPEDRDLWMTARREAEEEIGVDSTKIELLGSLSDLYIPPSNFLVSPYIGFTTQTPEFVPDPFEVANIISFPVHQLVHQRIRKSGTIRTGAGLSLKAPYFAIDGEVVWGATAMILGELMYLWENQG
jgi:8-oxo-dGTP pyrophosphatase MutT (NUDIX family)